MDRHLAEFFLIEWSMMKKCDQWLLKAESMTLVYLRIVISEIAKFVEGVALPTLSRGDCVLRSVATFFST